MVTPEQRERMEQLRDGLRTKPDSTNKRLQRVLDRRYTMGYLDALQDPTILRLQEDNKTLVEKIINHCESTDLPMEIVLKETKKDYGIRIINALVAEIREKFQTKVKGDEK